MKRIGKKIAAAVVSVLTAAAVAFTPAARLEVRAETTTGLGDTVTVTAGQDPGTLANIAMLAQIAGSRGLTAKYQGKTLSILGDSISTFAGTLPEGYINFYPAGGIHAMNQTWWGGVMSATGMKLLKNCSWATSCMSGGSEDSSGKPGCSTKRISDLSMNGYAPDVIFVMMGTNDLLSNINVNVFHSAYDLCLSKLQARYPFATIVCFTCFPCICDCTGTNYWNNEKQTINDYNAAIIQSAAVHGVQVVDTYSCGINTGNYKQMTCEGIHPNQAGAFLASYLICSTMQ